MTCNLGSLAAGATVSKVLGVSWSDAGAQTVKATVTSSDPPTRTLADNTETETTAVN